MEEDDLKQLVECIEQAELRKHQKLHPEDFNPDGTVKLHTRSIKGRLSMVVIVMVTLSVADHVVHLEWIVRGSEMCIAAFFDWFFNVAKSGEVTLPKVLRRK